MVDNESHTEIQETTFSIDDAREFIYINRYYYGGCGLLAFFTYFSMLPIALGAVSFYGIHLYNKAVDKCLENTTAETDIESQVTTRP